MNSIFVCASGFFFSVQYVLSPTSVMNLTKSAIFTTLQKLDCVTALVFVLFFCFFWYLLQQCYSNKVGENNIFIPERNYGQKN